VAHPLWHKNMPCHPIGNLEPSPSFGLRPVALLCLFWNRASNGTARATSQLNLLAHVACCLCDVFQTVHPSTLDRLAGVAAAGARGIICRDVEGPARECTSHGVARVVIHASSQPILWMQIAASAVVTCSVLKGAATFHNTSRQTRMQLGIVLTTSPIARAAPTLCPGMCCSVPAVIVQQQHVLGRDVERCLHSVMHARGFHVSRLSACCCFFVDQVLTDRPLL